MTEPSEYLRVSYSSLNTFAGCARKFEFQKLYPRRDRVFDDNYAAEVGKALHAGYQEYLVNQSEEKAIWAFMQAFPYELEFNQETDYRSFEASLSVLEELFIEASMQDYELAKIRRPNTPAELESGMTGGVVVPAIEVPFELRFKGLVLPDGRGVAFTGYIDAIMRNLMTRLYRTLDIKTHRDSMKDLTAKYKFDSQQVPYGIVVDHISGDTNEAFEVLYLSAYIDLLEPRVTLYPFTKTPEDVQEWATNKLLQFQSIQRFMANDYFPRTDSGCLQWKKPCPYLEPCQSRSRPDITDWFLLGEEPKKTEPFFPWVVADIDLGVAA